MPGHSTAEIGRKLRAIPGDKMSEACKDLITRMTQPEATRLTINEALAHPFLRDEQSSTEMADVLQGLITLGQHRHVKGSRNDFFCFEVGTHGSHIIQADKFGVAYDLD